ncbi:MAG TPA: glycosyltransferase family 2 protein [Solirubrobacterales bacterium]|nr:glycosyltransferase family 2 protein [Solirubrobacterales bacterium]
MPSGAEGVGVVVLAYGAGGRHEELLRGLLGEGVPAGSILLVHNPARPGEAPPQPPPGCELLQADRNLGYAGGMNLGLERQRRSGCELILLLTHDARLGRGGFNALVAAARRQPRFGAIGPLLNRADNGARFSCGGITRANGTNAHLAEPRPVEGGIAPCDWVDGGTMVVRAEAVERAGAFDERFWGYCEEADLCLRFRRAGFAVGVAVDAVAEQDPGGPRRPGAWAYLLTRNGAAYAWRAAGIRGALTIELRAAWLTLSSVARAALRLVRHRPGGPAEPWAVAVGTARGAIDFLRGRWGPPPPGLPGMGDVGNA